MNGWVPTVFVRETDTHRAVILFVHDKNGGEWKWDVYKRPSRQPHPLGHGAMPIRSGVTRTAGEAADACDAVMGPAEKRSTVLPDVFGLVPIRGAMKAPAFTTEQAARAAAKALDLNPKSADVPAVGVARYELKEIRPV